ncbi:MAG: hypothetical protein U5O39_00335 [Gammaproteobacteria bacterium]|nr:hypothetical protein [Gammaproteobacteria bacterium]
MIDEAIASDLAPVELWCAPDTKHPFFSRFAGATLHTQVGRDLGERMDHALAEARSAVPASRERAGGHGLPTHRPEVPGTRARPPRRARCRHRSGGGRRLWSDWLRRSAPSVFAGIEWSTSTVAGVYL